MTIFVVLHIVRSRGVNAKLVRRTSNKKVIMIAVSTSQRRRRFHAITTSAIAEKNPEDTLAPAQISVAAHAIARARRKWRVPSSAVIKVTKRGSAADSSASESKND